MSTYNPMSYFETARLTLRAILQLRNPVVSHMFDEEPPHEGGLLSWATRLRSEGETTLSWHIVADENGLVDISRSVSFLTPSGKPVDHTTLVTQVDLNGTSNYSFSQLILQLIIGTNEVPIKSRKEAREWVRVARQDAEYVYAVGMNRILSHGMTGGAGWKEADDPEKFEFIREHAELAVGHALATHKETWRQAGVPFRSTYIYQDAFTDKAVDLLSTLDMEVRR